MMYLDIWLETFLSAITEQQIKTQKYPAHLRKQNP